MVSSGNQQPVELGRTGRHDRWGELSALAHRTVGERFGSGDLVVEYHWYDGLGESHHHQVFEQGRLVGWESGSAPAAVDVVLRQPWSVHMAMLARKDLNEDVLGATRVMAAGSSEPTWPPPLDEVRCDWAGALAEIPTAGAVVVEQVLTGSPFGDVRTFFEVERGRLVACGLGPARHPNVLAERRYALALAEWAGEIDVFDSFDGGRVVGDTPSLALFLGVYDSDECRAARRALARPCGRALATLGELLSSNEWTALVAPLAVAATDVGSVP